MKINKNEAILNENLKKLTFLCLKSQKVLEITVIKSMIKYKLATTFQNAERRIIECSGADNRNWLHLY